MSVKDKQKMSNLRVIDFYADWCGPCQVFSETFKSVSSTTEGVEFVKVNIDQDHQKARDYSIRSIPTVIIEREGQILHRKVGILSEVQLRELIEQSR
jgi:thioredoxin 1